MMILLSLFCFILLTGISHSHPSREKDDRSSHRSMIPALPTSTTNSSPSLRRFPSPVQIIPVPCAPDRARRTSLTQEQLMQIFIKNGGIFRPSLMATDEKSASSNFPNLLPIGQSKEIYIKDVKIPVTKQKLLDDLGKWDSFLKSVPKKNHSMSKEENDHYQSAMKLLGAELGDYIISHRITPESIIDFINVNDIVHHPKIITVVKKPDQRWKRQISDTQPQYCQYRGNQTVNGFINFCTTCVVTTDLGEDIFPRYINEIVCNVEPCLAVNHNPHGACQENILHLTFLRRAPNGCLMVIKDRIKEQTHSWESYTQRIRVGCSCKLDKRSRLKHTFGFGK